LKLSQRIALYLLKDQSSPVKTAGLVGRMMASHLYDHGDASAADAVSRMAAPFLNNYPLVQGEGAFGTRVAPLKGIGAARYTEVKRSKFSEKYLYMDMDLCPLRENYDGSTMMPQTFLPIIPMVLLNGIKGIAVGFATNILPRSLQDITEAVKEVLTTGRTTKPLMPFYERYNGPVIQDHKNPKKFYLHGVIEKVNTTTVKITDLPPTMELETIIAKLISLEEEKKIVSFVDNSTDKIDITVKFTRANLASYTDTSLITLFKLVVNETENITVISPDGSHVKQYDTPNELLEDFVNWRLQFYKMRYEKMLSAANDLALYYRCFILCFEDIDGETLVDIIQHIESKSELMEMIDGLAELKSLKPSKEILSKIASLPIYTFTVKEKTAIEKKLQAVLKDIEEYKKIIKSEKRQKSIFAKEIA